MTVKTIALLLLSPAEADTLAPAACALARQLDAHVTALHPSEPVVMYGVGLEPAVLPAYADWQRDDDAEVEAIAREAARREGIAFEYRGQPVQSLAAEAFMLSCLHGADLVVTGTARAGVGEPPGHRRLRNSAIRHSGRPVLVLPPGAEARLPARRLVIGWSDTREAARAGHDALALARMGAEVDLLSIGAPAMAGSREDFAAALDRRGFSASLVNREATGGETGAALLDAAAERGADLLATGAFGHSQVYDFVIGAVTSHLLEHSPLPVLLSK